MNVQAPHAKTARLDHRIEIFDPVLALHSFESDAEAATLAEDTDCGPVAGIWTADTARTIHVARQIRARQVFVNSYAAGGAVELPFGGMKNSGHAGIEALIDCSTTRTFVLNHVGIPSDRWTSLSRSRAGICPSGPAPLPAPRRRAAGHFRGTGRPRGRDCAER